MLHPRPIGLWLLMLTVVALVLTALDQLVDASGGWFSNLTFDFVDRLLNLAAIVASVVVLLRLSRLQERTDDLAGSIKRAANEGRAWRAQSRKFLDGLSRSIEAQFDTWQLSPAEADVAGLLLKGASLREIAVLRRTAEATIRQQAQSVYRKSGLASRTELSAFFMEDLFTIGEVSITHGGREDRFDA